MKINTVRAQSHKMFCEYSIFQENNFFNQIVKYVATVLYKTTTSLDNRNLLRKLLHILADVDDRFCVFSDTEKVQFNRTQNEFIPILNYCRLFLGNSLIKFNNEKLDVFCFLLDMNVLFEQFVTGFLKKHFRDRFKVEAQKSDRYVAMTDKGEKVFQMQHDIFLTEHETENKIIVDTKYKPTNFNEKKGGISQADLYQMASYAIRRNCTDVILLYPQYYQDNSINMREFSIRYELSERDIRLTCFKLDLTNLKGDKKAKDELIKTQLSALI